MAMTVIVVRQPWAWLIVNGHKDIENRSWRTHYRGALLIQASANLPSQGELDECRAFAKKRGVTLPDEYETGGIVGIATLKDRVTRSRSKWFQGPIGWVLTEPKRLRFLRMKGRLGLFDPPPAIRKRVLEQLEGRGR
jgi:hypothetical protein